LRFRFVLEAVLTDVFLFEGGIAAGSAGRFGTEACWAADRYA